MNTKNEIPLADYRALAEFRYQIRRFHHFSEQMARTAGLEPQQHQLLLAIKGLPLGKQATIGELAERLQIQHHSAVELVSRMVDRGFVARQRDEKDQRRVIVHLTTKGEEILLKLSSIALAELRSTGPDLVHALNMLARDKENNLSDENTSEHTAIHKLEDIF
ncbi:MarR family winged helix-turn-helix transcriptional regulator [Ktedonosporobacter rubrisoli]|nr:MarR family transcriptional regulator [Ktedonosporobacter rubrisoli]